MLTVPTLTTGCFALILLLASPARAQESFFSLGGKVSPGDKIAVIDQQGTKTEGRIASISDTSLVVDFSQGRIADPTLTTTRTFAPRDVRRVLKPGHIWDGAIKGAAIGAIPALLFAAVDCYDCGEGSFAAFSIGVGAAIGVGIDALWGPKTVYRGEPRASSVSLAPIAGPRGRRGVAASIRF